MLSVQSAIADLAANAAGFVTSDGASASIGIDPQETLVYALGNASATSGSGYPNRGLVTVFEH